MTGRVSTNEVYAQLRGSVFNNFAQLFKSQTILTTGSRLQRPSDDPVGTRRALSLDAQQAGIARNLDTISGARAHLETGSASLLEISGIVTRIRELTVQGANGPLTANERAAIAQEVDGLLATIVQAANVRADNRYVFSGARTDVAPFRIIEGADGLTRVDYFGDGSTQEVEIGPGVRALINLPGNEAFRRGSRTATRFFGTTGALPGAGSDSGSGRDVLQITHTATLFGATPGPSGQDPITGLRPGPSSKGNDTVLGTSHNIVLSTDASGAGTISLNGGSDVAFSGSETDLVVTGPNGERIHVDVTGLALNLAPATVAVDGRGAMSIDGGRKSVPIDFSSAAQQIVDSETGSVLHVDARGIVRTGEEQVSYEGTFDLFEVIIAIRDSLRNAESTPEDVSRTLNLRLADLDRDHAALTQSLAILGGRSSQLDATQNRLSDLDVTLSALKSSIQDADLSEVIINMKKQEALYQASLMMVSRVNDLSLLNFI